METEIVRFAQTNAGRIRLAGLFFLAISTLTRLSCLTFAAETNCWMWMIFVFECLWSCKCLFHLYLRQGCRICLTGCMSRLYRSVFRRRSP